MPKSTNEIFSTGRLPNKVISVVENVQAAPVKDERYMPFELPSYSRFIVTIIDTSGETKIYPFANIPAKHISTLWLKKNIAMQAKMQAILDLSHTSGKTEYTAVFRFGSLAGKTIPQVLGDNPTINIAVLQKQKEFLIKNLEKFPANKSVIAEIERAEKEVSAGTYSASAKTPAASGFLTVYESEWKPLKSRSNDDGDVFVYKIVIVCDFSKESAWKVSISNGYCPMETSPAGLDVPILSKMTGKTSASFSMTDEEFVYMVDRMYDIYQQYGIAEFSERFAAAHPPRP